MAVSERDFSKVYPQKKESVNDDEPSINVSDIKFSEKNTHPELVDYTEIFEEKKNFSDKNPMLLPGADSDKGTTQNVSNNASKIEHSRKGAEMVGNIISKGVEHGRKGAEIVWNTMSKGAENVWDPMKKVGNTVVEGVSKYGTPAVEKAANVITTIKEYNFGTTITDEKIKNMLMNKQRESIQTKTDIKDYFKNSTSGKYFYEYNKKLGQLNIYHRAVSDDEKSDLQLLFHEQKCQITKFSLKSDLIKTIKDTPFSYVAAFETDKGKVFLKATPELIAEPKIIKVLAQEFNACVPKVISEHPKLNIFLMKDAGSSLRELLKNEFNTSLVCEAINQFTQTQIAISLNTNRLVEIIASSFRLFCFSSQSFSVSCCVASWPRLFCL
ncbi:MAG: hypothetical protein EBS19_13940 [Spirochaetia bacterium]|nr:hypothetical protein [Spirochaetia bacterium]